MDQSAPPLVELTPEQAKSDRVHDAGNWVVASLLAKDFGAGDDRGLIKR
jgi:hypothetical protein